MSWKRCKGSTMSSSAFVDVLEYKTYRYGEFFVGYRLPVIGHDNYVSKAIDDASPLLAIVENVAFALAPTVFECK